MKYNLGKIASLATKTPVILIVLVAFVLGYMFKGAVSTTSGSAATGQVEEVEEEVWTCSMHPEIRLPNPGKCPKCGMTLILAESKAKKSKSNRPKKYACAMMCVPPMSKPGDCPICGMKMVEVEDEGGDEDDDPRTLTLSPSAQKLAEVQVAPVERKFVEARIRMVGKIDYDETLLKYITAWVPGRLDRLYVDYTGVPVKKGDHLVYMYSPELLVAQIELLRSIKTANEIRAVASKDVRLSAEALVEDGREKLRLWGLTQAQIRGIEERGQTTDHMTIYAPIGGIVVHKNATEGMYVDTGTRIYTIADLSHLWVKLDAYESDLAWIRYGQTVEFETEAYAGETFTGKVAFIDPVLDGRTRTVKVRVNVDNPDGRLKPQMFVRAVLRAKLAEDGSIVNTELAGKWIGPMHPEIIKDEQGNCDICGMPLIKTETLGFVSPNDLGARPPLVVPASAVLMTGTRAVVYVALPDRPGTYQGRVIVPGARAGDYYLVRNGLTEGEQVVVNGNFKIDSAIQIRAKPSMMSPDGGVPAPGHQHHGAQGQAAAGSEPQAERFEVPGDFSAQLKPLFKTYFRVQKALNLDSAEDAIGAAKEFCKALDAVDMSLLQGAAHQAWMKELKDITRPARKIVAADHIEKARSAFAMWSESMIGVAKRFGTGDGDIYRFRCPMAFNNRGADWLQNNQETANPYFGSVMSRCGVLKETFAGYPSREPGGPPPRSEDSTGDEDPAPDHQQHGAEGGMSVPHAKGQAPAEPFEVPGEFSAQLKPLFSTYFRVQKALSLDSDEDAEGAAKDFRKALDAVDMSLLEGAAHQAWMMELKDITKPASRVATAIHIERARSAFAMISESMIGVAERFGTGDRDIYRFHCPMAFDNRGADWLQDNRKTANPYFGSAMFGCGVLKETFTGDPARDRGGPPPRSGDSTGDQGDD